MHSSRWPLFAVLSGLLSVLCYAPGVNAAPVNNHVLISAPSKPVTVVPSGAQDDESRSLYSYRTNVITSEIVFLVHAEVSVHYYKLLDNVLAISNHTPL